MGELTYDPIQQQTQSMLLSQQQLQSLKMLELNMQELDELLQKEFTENPALEWVGGNEGRTRGPASSEQKPAWEGSRELYSDEEQWKNHLLDQLSRQSCFSQYARVFLRLLEWADEDGLFRTPVKDFCEATGIHAAAAGRCLRILRELDPPGIFAAGIPQCLIKQAQKKGWLDHTLETIILKHMDAVASGYYARVASDLHLSRRAMDRYIARIRELSPHPLNGIAAEAAHCIVPDVVLRRTDGQWEALLNDGHADGYGISAYYADMCLRTDSPELKAYLKQSIDRAKMLLNAINQRRETIMKLVGAVVKYQPAWLEHRGPLRPMTMTWLAGQLQVHPSTISRTVKGKYIEISTRGVVAMKDLFSQEVSAHGTSANAQEVYERIRELIAREPKDAPYSDQQIAALLEMQDIFLSRRTVAKYRKLLLIPSAFARRV